MKHIQDGVKFYMLHYIANQNFVGDHIHTTKTAKEMLEDLKANYARNRQPSCIYAVFCFDEATQEWKGFNYEEAVDYLTTVVKALEYFKEELKCQKAGKK